MIITLPRSRHVSEHTGICCTNTWSYAISNRTGKFVYRVRYGGSVRNVGQACEVRGIFSLFPIKFTVAHVVRVWPTGCKTPADSSRTGNDVTAVEWHREARDFLSPAERALDTGARTAFGHRCRGRNVYFMTLAARFRDGSTLSVLMRRTLDVHVNVGSAFRFSVQSVSSKTR